MWKKGLKYQYKNITLIIIKSNILPISYPDNMKIPLFKWCLNKLFDTDFNMCPWKGNSLFLFRKIVHLPKNQVYD
jgi:hypothetical protein